MKPSVSGNSSLSFIVRMVNWVLQTLREQFQKQTDTVIDAIRVGPLTTQKVEVTNADTKILLETAENTRKSASRMIDVQNRLSDIQTTFLTHIEEKKKHWEQKETKKDGPKDVRIVNFRDFPSQKEPVSFPKEIRVSNLEKFPSSIRVGNLSDIPKTDTSVVEKILLDIVASLQSFTKSFSSSKKESVSFPKSIDIGNAPSLIDALQGVRDDLGGIHDVIKESGGKESSKTIISSSGATVSSVSINALRGVARTTALTVGTDAIRLPTTALSYRKSMVLFNNSSNTIYVGGSDVSVTNGLPVPSQSYSPPIDAGSPLALYAIASQAGNNIRVLEVSSEREGAAS